MSASLRTKKKSELQDICQQWGLDDSGLKSDLESRLFSHLKSGKATSAQKREVNYDVDSVPEVTETPRKLFPEGSPGRSLVESARKKVNDFEEAVVRSNKKVMHSISSNTGLGKLWDNFRNAITTDQQNDVEWLRKTFSTTEAIIALFVCIEFIFFIGSTFPLSDQYNVRLPGLAKHEYLRLNLPNLQQLQEWTLFWKPLLIWQFYLNTLPFLVASVVGHTPGTNFNALTFCVFRYAIQVLTDSRLLAGVFAKLPIQLFWITCATGVLFSLARRV